MKDGKSVKINTTESIGSKGPLSDTLSDMEKWDMNQVKDPVKGKKG